MAFGLIDTRYIDWPSNVDETYLRNLQTRSGLQVSQLAGLLDGALAAINDGADPLIASLIYPTTGTTVRGNPGGALEVQRRSQYTLPRPQHMPGKRAHMLPVYRYEAGLGFTEDGLEAISLADFNDNLDRMRAGWERQHRRDTLHRLFSDEEVPVDEEGTTVVSPAFAGSGTGANAFQGEFPDGTTMPNGYTHYFRDTEANLGSVLKAARNVLKKWYAPPFDVIAPESMVSKIAALPDFIRVGSPLVRPAPTAAEALVDADTYVGVFDGDVRVRQGIIDFDDPNIALTKIFGAFSPQNPLAWRYDTMWGRGVFVRSRSLYPLAESVALQKYGVGVNNRVSTCLIRIDASGGYVAPAGL